MARKKRKRSNNPRRKRLRRKVRLQQAPAWLRDYSGKDPIKGYSKWYAVSEVCAIIELRMLGLEIPEERLERAKASEMAKVEARRKKRAARAAPAGEPWDSDDTFAFIFGYTNWGFPYGTTWEELGYDPRFDELPDAER